MRRGAGPAIGTSGPRRRPPTPASGVRPRLAARRVARNYIPKSESNSDTTRSRFISRQFRFRFEESVQFS